VTTPALDVGTPADYLRAALALTAAPGSPVVEPGADVAPSARLRRSVVWPSAAVGDRVELDDCIVLSGARVPSGFRAAGAILAAPSLVRPGDRAEIQDGVAVFPLAVSRTDS
jgi:NDP-sugar pyrophosphorylase family protein